MLCSVKMGAMFILPCCLHHLEFAMPVCEAQQNQYMRLDFFVPIIVRDKIQHS
jgi:hypothetical protein